MAYKIYKQKLLTLLAEQQEDGSYIIKPYAVSKTGGVEVLEVKRPQTMPQEIFEQNYELVEDTE